MRRAAPFACVVVVLALAGCGGEKTVRPEPETVVGTVQQAGPGKSIFTSQGCTGCHTYKPAGSSAKVGPDLDKLADYAKRANKPVDEFTRESIVNPNAYVEKGFPKGVMPDYSKLPESDVNALVEFLTKPQS